MLDYAIIASYPNQTAHGIITRKCMLTEYREKEIMNGRYILLKACQICNNLHIMPSSLTPSNVKCNNACCHLLSMVLKVEKTLLGKIIRNIVIIFGMIYITPQGFVWENISQGSQFLLHE